MYEQHALVLPLRAALATHRDVVLQAPPGAGKSTLVPLALLSESWLRGRKLLLLEPRRLAARAVAQRMASLLGERVGETVGYRMRLDTRVSRDAHRGGHRGRADTHAADRPRAGGCRCGDLR